MADESGDQPAAIFPQLEQVFPIQLGNEHPHGKPGLGAVFEVRDEPFRVMLAVKQMFSVQMRCQSGAAGTLAWAPRQVKGTNSRVVHLGFPAFLVKREKHMLNKLLN